MRRHPKISPALFLFVTVLAGPAAASAPQAAPAAPKSTNICAVLQDFSGTVQILDESRSEVREPAVRLAIPCGSWISVEEGHVYLKHREGHRLHTGARTFLQLLDAPQGSPFEGDHVLLFRGTLYGDAGLGAPELRVVTANARTRADRGAALTIFNERDEETQVIGLENSSTIENRFADARKMTVKAGEASTLNLKLLRVIPSAPRVISLAEFRSVLAGLHLEPREQQYALTNVTKRINRKFGEVFTAATKAQGKGRMPAGQAKASYQRHEPSPDDAKLQEHWTRKLSAGERAGEEILFPARRLGRQPDAKVRVDLPPEGRKRAVRNEEQAEKERLIEELGKIRD